MTEDTDIVYGPSGRLRLIPVAIAVCLQMAIGTFFVAYFNFNGLREPAGYKPPILFFALALVFFIVYLRGNLRITLGASAIVVERLFAGPRQIATIRYSDIGRVEEKKLSLKIILHARDGQVLFVIPTNLDRIRGSFILPDDPLEPAPDTGLAWERYKLREEISRRCGQHKQP